MKEKICEIFRRGFKFILFWGVVVFAGYMAFSKDPDINLIIRLVGFFAVIYFLAKELYQGIWKKD